jgi:hypothetical protein
VLLCGQLTNRAAVEKSDGTAAACFETGKRKASVPLAWTGGTWHRWQTRNWLKPLKTSGSRIELEQENQNARKQNQARRKRLRSWRSCSHEKTNEGQPGSGKRNQRYTGIRRTPKSTAAETDRRKILGSPLLEQLWTEHRNNRRPKRI